MRLHHRYVRVSVLSSDTSPTQPIALNLRPSRARGARGRVGGRYRRRGRVIGVAGRYGRRGRGRFSGSSRWRHRGGASAYETDRYRDRGGEGDIFQKIFQLGSVRHPGLCFNLYFSARHLQRRGNP